MVGEVEVVVVLELELVEIRLFFPAGEETKGDADRLWLDEEEEEEEEERRRRRRRRFLFYNRLSISRCYEPARRGQHTIARHRCGRDRASG